LLIEAAYSGGAEGANGVIERGAELFGRPRGGEWGVDIDPNEPLAPPYAISSWAGPERRR
jgi:hypothetical protein